MEVIVSCYEGKLGINNAKLLQQCAPVAWDYDVMVADGIGEEIAGLPGLGELDNLLCAAEVGLGLVTDKLPFGDELA